MQLTDGNGNIVRNYAYDAFGNQKETVNSGTEPYNPFRYTGEYFDAETGFIYLRARYMDPQTGRFVSEDPACDGVNWYAYAAGNPVMLFDPSGLVVTAWDEQHLTKSELEALEQYTKDWNDANKVGDEYGMYRAHANAEDIRRKYRDLNEITLDNGLTGTVSLDKDYSRIFTYVERREKEKQQYSFTEQMAMIVLFPFTALTSCESQQSYKEWVQEARLAGNKVNTGYGFNDYSIKFATSAYNHMQNANRYVPIPILIDVIQTGIPGADPQGGSAVMYYSVIERNNTMYNIEVLYNENTNTIYHFKYSSDAMGPLPAINRKGK